jgi:23S rRNA (cytosine1962-C5)-methyltransferase
MLLITPQHFTDYELIDSGNFQKLERFGKYILSRPEPQALWDKTLSENEWDMFSNADFRRNRSSRTIIEEDNERGEWLLKKGMPEQWFVNYSYKDMNLKFRLGLTSFKHVGLFPEQADNWNFIFDAVSSAKTDSIKVLNLFAYTGGASLAAKAAGADVTHVDSVRQVVKWSRENMEASRLNGIRWVVEDALKFVKREVRRGNRYHGIILDPPAYGRGPDGEKWILEKSINEILKLCNILLDETSRFFVLNLYSMSFSALIAQNLIETLFGKNSNTEAGEFYVPDRTGRKLPLGVFVRFN